MTQTIEKQLRYDFSAEENTANAKLLARTNQQLDESIEKRKRVNADLKADEARIAESITKLSRYVNDGYDFRQVACKVLFDNPRDGMKTIVRVDTGEIVETISMEDHERQGNLGLNNEDEPEPVPEDFDGRRPAY